MLGFFTILLGCQLAGEVLVQVTGLPVPGPVCGMVILFCGLAIKGGIPEELGRVSEALLSHLSLLFVPAGVGVMIHVNLLAEDWLAISVALLVSTALAIAVTAGAMHFFARRREAGDEEGKPGS